MQSGLICVTETIRHNFDIKIVSQCSSTVIFFCWSRGKGHSLTQGPAESSREKQERVLTREKSQLVQLLHSSPALDGRPSKLKVSELKPAVEVYGAAHIPAG